MFRKLMATFGIAAVLGSIAIATPAQASASDCPQTYVCGWTNANYSGSMWAWQPSAVFAAEGHCANIDDLHGNGYFDNKISSMKSQNAAVRQFRFYRQQYCANIDGWWTLTGAEGVSNLQGTGYNDTFSSVYVPYCC